MVGFTESDLRLAFRRNFRAPRVTLPIEPWAPRPMGRIGGDVCYGFTIVETGVGTFRFATHPANDPAALRERWERREDEAVGVMGWHQTTGGEA